MHDALLRTLAACALSAPSKSYLQQADIIAVQDSGQRRKVEALVPKMPWMRQAPLLLVFCGNGRRFRQLFERAGQPFANEHLDGFFNPAVDASLVLMNFMQSAAAAGLVCCPISVLRDQAAALRDILALPAHVFPVAGLCAGYPAEQREPNPRLALSATLHLDRFDNQGQAQAIEDFDRRYVAARQRHAPQAAQEAPQGWSQERVQMYREAQRADWGQFVRSQGFRTE